jgi:type II secretory pathway pseudopilin PulG
MGVTLIEIVVVVTLLGMVGAVIGTTLTRQQRFYRGASELLNARENVRDAIEVLSTDIRGLSVADTTMALTDSAFEFFATIGTAVVCAATAGPEVGLAGVGEARGNTFTAMVSQPDTGDLALFYRIGSVSVGGWDRARITDFGSRMLSAVCPGATPFTVGSGGRGFAVTISGLLPGGIRAGTPVRFIRRGRYSLYHASDGEWYLGYRRCNAVGPAACGAIQPLSGPYRAYNRNRAETGLLFEYYDANGATISDAASAISLARVEVTARAESHHIMTGAGGRPSDSATVAIAIRNARR